MRIERLKAISRHTDNEIMNKTDRHTDTHTYRQTEKNTDKWTQHYEFVRPYSIPEKKNQKKKWNEKDVNKIIEEITCILSD